MRSRLDQLAAIINPQRVVPTTMEFVDIAGLVAGASKGEGLGNQFLANIRETEAIGHVVRCFDDDNIVHVAGKVSPADDIEVIDTELALSIWTPASVPFIANPSAPKAVTRMPSWKWKPWRRSGSHWKTVR